MGSCYDSFQYILMILFRKALEMCIYEYHGSAYCFLYHRRRSLYLVNISDWSAFGYSVGHLCKPFDIPLPPFTGLIIWALRYRRKTFKPYFSKWPNRRINSLTHNISTGFQLMLSSFQIW